MLAFAVIFLIVLARYTLFLDGADYTRVLLGGIEEGEFVPGKVDRDTLRSAIAQRHQGDGPCLRVGPEVEQSQLSEFEEDAAAAGLTERFIENGFFVDLFWSWSSEWAAEMHDLETAEELLAAMTQEVGTWDRILIWLNHDKLIDALGVDEEWRLERLEEQGAALTAQEHEALRSLWTSCPVCTTPLALMRLTDPMQRHVTATRMERIEACLQASPSLPLPLHRIPCIDDVDLRDGWEGSIEFDAETSDLISLGADGMEGGTGWDADIREHILLR